MVYDGNLRYTQKQLWEMSPSNLASTQPIPSPKSLVESGGKNKFTPFSTESKRDRKRMRKWQTMYKKGGLYASALDLYPLLILSSGYRLEGDAGGKYQDWLDSINFNKLVWLATIDSLLAGYSIQENVGTIGSAIKRRNDITAVFPRDPIPWDINTNDKGIITGYTQVKDENTGAGLTLPPEDITCLVLLPQSGSPYGISMMERAEDDIIRDVKITESSSIAIQRHGWPKYHIKVGQAGESISKDDLQTVSTEFQDMDAKTEWATCADIAIDNIDKTGIENLDKYNEVSVSRVCAALGVPEEMLGLTKASTNATAVSRINAFFMKIKTFQGIVADCYNKNVLDRKTGKPGSVKIVFEEPDPADMLTIADMIHKIISVTPQDPFAILPREFILDKLGIAHKYTPIITPTSSPTLPKQLQQ